MLLEENLFLQNVVDDVDDNIFTSHTFTTFQNMGMVDADALHP
jgi:ribosomal protein RSM22 (predicted rRNA methylase)